MSTRRKSALIAIYLAVQLLLPLRGFVYDKHATQGNFSWNMYSKGYECSVDYTLVKPRERLRRILHRRLLDYPGDVIKLYNRDVLPRLHAWLCEDARRQSRSARIMASGSCRLNGGPWQDLFEPHVDLCTAPNYGVRTP